MASRNVRDVINHKTWTDVQPRAISLNEEKPTGEITMAKAPKSLTPADKKLAQAGLKQAVAAHNVNIRSISATLKAADAKLAAVKKDADAAVKAASKSVAGAMKAAQTTVKTAQKDYAAAFAKAAKHNAAAAVGTAKLSARQAALDAVPVAVAPKVVAGRAPKAAKAPVAEKATAAS